MRRALVFGGTGTIGREVISGLAEANIDSVFTYYKSKDLAFDLKKKYNQKAYKLDLSNIKEIRDFFNNLDFLPDIFIHCAGIANVLDLNSITDDDWNKTITINSHSALVACQMIVPNMISKNCGDIVFIGALDRTQSIAIPSHFAASQGMLSAITMSLAKELGIHNIRVNMISLGLLDAGLSRNFNQKLKDDFIKFSSLKREATSKEISNVIIWLATNNTYMTGKVLPVNGGI
ncbi:MAG: SDR family oxidoreductase [Spirochaetota bacterium]|nr:SDR family oxidoreductase [Spirochaetota bacterium]